MLLRMGAPSDDRRHAIFERDGYRCTYCGREFPAAQLTVDHIQPRVKRGDNSPGNLVTACRLCNREKGSMAAWEYLRDKPVERQNFLRYATRAWKRHLKAVSTAGGGEQSAE